jgi:hypothetical protein
MPDPTLPPLPDVPPQGHSPSVQATLYEGLSRSHRLWVVACTVAVVVLNMSFAAWIMWDTLNHFRFSTPDGAMVNALSQGLNDLGSERLLRAKALDALANIKLVTNKQATIIVGFSGAFSLLAMGFALFVLGADGAFRATVDGYKGVTLMLGSTAPGLLCFVLATGIVVTGVLHKSELTLGTVTFPTTAASSAPAAPQVCGPSGDCLDDSVFKSSNSPGEKK